MKRNLLFASILFSGTLFSQISNDTLAKNNFLDEFVVKAIRVKKNSPVAHENVSSEELNKANHGVDIPILLDAATSVVTTSDAGSGVGYTGLRIRGSDATRINVTVNGIPLNDAESHGVWWVNMPDFASSTNDIQIQRGIGTSTNGTGAFGASISLNTLDFSDKAYGEISNSFGSFSTIKNTIKLGTGTLNGKWNLEGRLSRIQSEGYINRASSDLSSYFVSAGYSNGKSKLKAISFSGHEKTYQAWNGVPLRYLDSLRQYNPYTYDNEVDNYSQNHYQLHYNYNAYKNLKLSASLHYTKGGGYYEQYKGLGENTDINSSKENMEDYGISPITFNDPGDTLLILNPFPNPLFPDDTLYYDVLGDTTFEISQTDLIRRRWLDNHFYGLVFSAEYTLDKLDVIVGGGANQYIGRHFGEIIWAEYANNSSIRTPYYDNDATKNDINFYSKINYKIIDNLQIFGDVQYRMVDYNFIGFNDSLETDNIDVALNFINPKAGVSYFKDKHLAYAYVGVGNKEPNRNDYTNSSPQSRPNAETMTDLEFGYSYSSKKIQANVNLYSMNYANQLILTGEINDVGAAIRTNIPDSYRRGVEITCTVKILEKLYLSGNVTLSENKIKIFENYIDNWDTWGQDKNVYFNTNIAFSPSVIAASQIIYSPIDSDKFGNLELALITKYVGEQYIDNTSQDYAKLDSYITNDIRLNYTLMNFGANELIISGIVRNILDSKYVSNAWIYRFSSDSYNPVNDDVYVNVEGDRYNMIGAFPQAGRNYFVGLTLKF